MNFHRQITHSENENDYKNLKKKKRRYEQFQFYENCLVKKLVIRNIFAVTCSTHQIDNTID